MHARRNGQPSNFRTFGKWCVCKHALETHAPADDLPYSSIPSSTVIIAQLLVPFLHAARRARRSQRRSASRLQHSHGERTTGGALLGIAQKLAAGESRQITTGLNAASSSASLPNRPEALDLYWWGFAQNFVTLLLLRHLRVRRSHLRMSAP